MSYFEMSFDDLDEIACTSFWQQLISHEISSVAIDLATESASVVATNLVWRSTGKGPIGVRLYLYNLMVTWSKLAESCATDKEYEETVFPLARAVLRNLESRRPNNLSVTYSIDEVAIEA